MLRYLHALESGGERQLVVWPVHCVLGTWGHNIHAGLLRNPGDMGSGMIPHGLKPSDMLILHLCGEVWEPSTVKDGRQIPGFWAHPHGGWDLLDCTRYGYALGLLHLYHPDSYDNRPASQEETQSIDDARSWITGY